VDTGPPEHGTLTPWPAAWWPYRHPDHGGPWSPEHGGPGHSEHAVALGLQNLFGDPGFQEHGGGPGPSKHGAPELAEPEGPGPPEHVWGPCPPEYGVMLKICDTRSTSNLC